MNTKWCLFFSLMNLGNSLMVREDKFCSNVAYPYLWLCGSLRGLLLFFLTTAFLGPISGDQVNGLRFFVFIP